MPSNSYTRQSSFSNGDVADATLINAEFDQIVEAFKSDDGHTHDGTAGQGAPVPKISSGTSSVSVDTSDPSDHKIIFTLDGVEKGVFSEVTGFSSSILNMKVEDLSNVSTPVSNGFFRWNATSTSVDFSPSIDAVDLTGFASVATAGTVVSTSDVSAAVSDGFWRWDAAGTLVTYSTTIAHSDITGLDSVNFTHDSQNLLTFLTALDARTVDAGNDAAAAAASAAASEESASDAEDAAMALGVPVYVSDLGSYSIDNSTQVANIVYEGEGTLVLPTVLVKGRRFIARVSFKAVSNKTLTIANPNFSIIGDFQTLVAGEDLLLSPGDKVTLEAVSTTELEIV